MTNSPERCANCDAAIIEQETIFKTANRRLNAFTVQWVNFVNESGFPELCNSCGDAVAAASAETLDHEIAERQTFIENRVSDFPMFTGSWLPASADVRLKGLITANVTVGTGIFSELSQSFSDLVGAVNVSSGMSFKVNKGEASARAISVAKAVALGGNCVLGVNVDYGSTTNNAATINIQGTAAVISNLEDVLHADDLAKAQELRGAFSRLAELKRSRAGDIKAV